MKKAILNLLIGLALFAGGYIAANTQPNLSCTGGPDCPCDPCPFK